MTGRSLPHRLTGWATGVWDSITPFRRELSRDRISDLAASVTFFTLLTLPAVILALVASLGSLAPLVGDDLATNARQATLDWAQETFGEDAGPITTAVSELFDQSRVGVATIGFAVALIALSRGFGGLIRALDVAYGVDEARRWWRLRLTALGLGLGTVGIAAAALWLRYGLWPDLPDRWAVQWLRHPLLFGVLIAWAATLYHVAPNHRTPWRVDLPGAALTAIGWLVLVAGFAGFTSVASGANGFLGLAGAALAVFTLAYLMSLVLLLGAKVNKWLSGHTPAPQEVPGGPTRRRRPQR